MVTAVGRNENSGEHNKDTMLTLVGDSTSTTGTGTTDQVDDQVQPQHENDGGKTKGEEEVQEEEKKSATG